MPIDKKKHLLINPKVVVGLEAQFCTFVINHRTGRPIVVVSTIFISSCIIK
jgi:hypothetical protein